MAAYSSYDDLNERLNQRQKANAEQQTQQRISDFLSRYPQSPQTLEGLSADKEVGHYIPRLPWAPSPQAASGNPSPEFLQMGIIPPLFPPNPEHELQGRLNAYQAQQHAYEQADRFPAPAPDVIRAIIKGKTPAQLLEEQQRQTATAANTPAAATSGTPAFRGLASTPVPAAPGPVDAAQRPHSNGTVYGSPIADAMIQQATGVDTAAAGAAQRAQAERDNLDAVFSSPLYGHEIDTLRRAGLDEVTAAQMARMRVAQAYGMEGPYLRNAYSAEDRQGYQRQLDREQAQYAGTGDPRAFLADGNQHIRGPDGSATTITPSGHSMVASGPQTYAPYTPFGHAALAQQATTQARMFAATSRANALQQGAIYRAVSSMMRSTDPNTAKEGTALFESMLGGVPNAFGTAADALGATGYGDEAPTN